MDKKLLGAITKQRKKMKNVKDDPVVKEIPIYLSKTLANELYVVQYPMYHKGYDDITFHKISIKPKNQKFRMECLMDTGNPESYDYTFGEELAYNAESESKGTDENEQMFSSGLMDKIVLASEGILPTISMYGVGIFRDDELHITPLKNLLRMRIQYDYLDESDKRERKEGAKTAGEDEDEDEDNPSPVKVTFARPLSENVKKKQSFHQHSKKTQEEHWIDTGYISIYDTLAELTRMQMFCQSPESLSTSDIEPTEYLQGLLSQVGTYSGEARYLRNCPEDQLDLRYILTMPLLDQIRIIMKRVQVISFSRLCQLLSPKHDRITVLKYLQQVALLVQGNWVVNSELVYPKDAHSEPNSELMCKARDYILLQFIEQQFVSYNTLSSFVRLQQDEMDKIFAGIATNVPKRGWRLKALPDSSFYESHPEVAQRQKVFWDAKQKLLREMLETQNQPPQRQRRKSHRESIGSENEERNVGRGRKSLRDSSLSDDSTAEPTKHKKASRSRKVSETT